MSTLAMPPSAFTSAVVLLLAITGCAQTTVLRSWGPPSGVAAGIRRLVVDEIEGADSLGESVRATLWQQLQAIRLYEVVDARQRPRHAAQPGIAMSAGSPPPTDSLTWARSIGADTLIRGHIQSGVGNSGFTVSNISFGDPVVQVTLVVELVDTATGTVRVREKFSQSYKGEMESNPRSRDSKDQIIARLARECSERAMAEIFAPGEPLKVKLATARFGKGSTALWRGNDFARRGDWQGAAAQWQAALQANPMRHQAVYNLGLACEATHDYASAESLYVLAQKGDDRPAYREAVRRAAQARQQTEVLLAQKWQAASPALAQSGPLPLAGTVPGPAPYAAAANTVLVSATVPPHLRRLPPVR